MLKIIKIILSIFCIVAFVDLGCLVSQTPNIEDYINSSENGDGDTIKVVIPYIVIPKLVYDEHTKPFVICLREKYAEALFDPRLHLEHILMRELYSNYGGISIDSLSNYSDEELTAMVIELFQPLFPDGKKKHKEVDSNESEARNSHLLDEQLKIQYLVQIRDKNHVEVVENNTYRWFLRKDNGKWKIYDGKRE